jgi:hypothetical protein
MFTRVRNVWHPENFHYHHRLAGGARRGKAGRGGSFEGWYLKLVDPAGSQPYAIIPGVFLGDDAHAFVQVLDGRAATSAYHRFPIEDFRADHRRFEVEIADNRFGTGGLRLDLDGSRIVQDRGGKRGGAIRGEIRFGEWRGWPVSPTSPGVMGPYSFAPFMECRHGILSLDHSLEGVLRADGVETIYDGGRGYVEKDWGKRFPAGYVWTQSNHFERPGTSVTASVARIPWLNGAFRGFLVGFLHDDRLHRFTTYNGGRIESLVLDHTHLRLQIHNRVHRLEIEARTAEGAVLHAPYEQQMLERVAEAMTSTIDLRFSTRDGDRSLYEGHGEHACLEVQGDLAAVLDAQ